MSYIVKNTAFLNVLDLIAPHTCRGCGRVGSPLCSRCKNYIIRNSHNFCPSCFTPSQNGHCQKCSLNFPIFSAHERSSIISQLIYDFKYDSVRALATPLAEIIGHSIPKQDFNVIIVPLPTIGKHIRQRGLDHTLLLAKKLAKYKKWRVKKLLIRTNSSVQVGANKKERKTQAANAYKINRKIKINQNNIYLLLDDVWTTGSSIKAAAKILRQAGIKNIAATVLAVSRFLD